MPSPNDALVAPYLTKFQQNSIGQLMSDPVDTVMAGAPRFGLVTPYLAGVTHSKSGGNIGAIGAPLRTVTTSKGGEQALIYPTLVQTGYGEACKPSREAPQDWAQGFQLVWPLRAQGLALTVRAEQQANAIVSIFPFIAHGSQQTLTLREVTVRTASRRQRHRVQAGLAGPADDGVSRRAFRVGGRTGARRRARASGVRSGLRPGLARHARQTLLRRRESRRGALTARHEAFQ